MTQTIQKNLNDHAWARWTAMVLIAMMMLFAHMFVDVISPIKELIQVQRGWTSDIFGTYAGSEYLLNVWGFLILAGIILDKMGIRFTGLASAIIMIIGAAIKFYAISDAFAGSGLESWLNSWWTSFPASAKLASAGFMIFGCGCEMAGITASKAMAKWFEGKEMALAMGLEMALTRVSVFLIFTISPRLAGIGGANPSVVRPVAFCLALLCIGLLFYSIFCVMDKKLDKQTGAADSVDPEDEFKFSDIGKIFSSKLFWIVAMLCVLYYSAIFPFQKFAANMLQSNLNLDATTAADIFRWFPIGAACVTPFLGWFLDKRGKGATMLILGALLMIVCHSIFALVLPAVPSKIIAYSAIILLGVSFSLVPAALWPSVPKIMDKRFLGSAYSLIFWVQNFGLSFTPMLIGWALEKTNPGVAEQIAAGVEGVTYNYTAPMLVFVGLGVLALLFALYLKADDRKNGYGLELPNIK
ncbi:MAG: MFS transporter [Alistipes sp.]|nr:MFS transporter [Alistipes sp.]MBP3496237.1 MFS transporter [Alistipes sp.]